MDYKLKAITNNVCNNDTVVDLIPRTNYKTEAKEAPAEHTCQRNVPVLFATLRGVHLRKFNKSSVDGNYSITFCDLERWVRELKTDGKVLKI